MSSNAIATQQTSIMEEVIAKGDLARLSPDQRAAYYDQVCRSMGLNSLTQPFQYITLSGKLTLYATRTATDQLRKINGVSVEIVDRETIDGVHIVTAKATDASGRVDTEIGAVAIKGLAGDALANALMKATTKAKRRVTLSICGLGFLDESELETIPTARVAHVDVETGVIVDSPGDAAVSALPAGEPMITDAQIRKIHALKNAKGLTDQGIKELHGKTSAKLLTRMEAGRFIDELESFPGAGELDADQSELVSADGNADRYTR